MSQPEKWGASLRRGPKSCGWGGEKKSFGFQDSPSIPIFFYH